MSGRVAWDEVAARAQAGRFWSKCTPVPWSGCLLWEAGCDKDGYGKFQITNPAKKPKQWHVRAHRFAHWLAAGESPEIVRHTCDVPACVNPEHIVGGTQKDNIADMDRRGRRPRGVIKPGLRGELHHRSKLTEAQVRQIKLMLRNGADGYGAKARIARAVGVTRGQVYRVASGSAWGWLDVG